MTDPTANDDEARAPVDPPGKDAAYGVPVTWSRGQRVLHPSRDGYLDLVKAMHADGYLVCVDVTATDYLTYRAPRSLPSSVVPERFEVVANLLAPARRERARIRVQVPEHDPVVASLFGHHPGVEAAEREVFDLFGISFGGHPDLTRILLPEDWDGHPLRKDAAASRIPVQFKSDHSTTTSV